MLTTIPARDIRPGDLIDTAGASRIPVRAVETFAGWTYVTEHMSGELIPPAYTFAADALVSRYSAR
jgi:hypothetical protein